ncbi:MAG TPA: glycosyltransferase family 4 protein [Lacunisphaera sp.]|nr:glycosyltransferase family 4 protein [Lacunisphaera sp.]
MSDAPRVIFVNRVYWPATAATAQLLTDLAESLAARGWGVHVVASGETDATRNGVIIHRAGPAVNSGGIVSRALAHRRFIRAVAAKLVTLARPGDIVVTMTDPPLLGPALAGAMRTQGVRLIHWIQDIYPEIASAHFGAFAGLALAPLRARRDSAWSDATACVLLGTDMAGLASARGVAQSRIHIIPNWAPRELQVPASASDVALHRGKLGLGGSFVLAYSGNLGRVHEFATILRVAALLRDDRKILFLFIGTGARFDEIAATSRRQDLPNIRLLPPENRTNLPVSLQAADAHLVTLLPAYRQLVYPSKLAGALAAGRPVVFVGPTGGEIAGLLRARGCGAAFAPGDVAGLAGHLRRLATDAALGQQQGAQGRLLYEQSFHADAALAAWDRLLRQQTGRA